VTIDQFKELIDGILATKGSLIAAGATVENGWEKWLQKAIIDTLAEKHITYDLAPEQHVYDNRDATADFVGNGPNKDNPNVAVTDKTFVVELKCQGRNASLFKAGLEIDCNKLRKREMNAAYQSARRYVFGVVVAWEPSKG
ncbi:hypothetical protein K7462_30480, partial [Pseudomonas fluorescens]|nr:hypothetical protein [Pseudomonas fluorescens]